MLVKRIKTCCTLCCMLQCCGQGFGAGVLSKSGARAGKISLPFSAERPIMNTGMPASFLSVESIVLYFEGVS